ncbi:type VII secretion integral membrane protein EccD [Mycobacterium sp. AZCC_0083]|uniref:type VII secretion integral membrane protein EccD n=1 Tax=Mycobacterium sp. AZCC_0083 TaxID=2735882 RepID=UPI0028155CD0|nr:type VII secretion integral membrane protein EccD [Mycobacterium sp. AZCC_0083]
MRLSFLGKRTQVDLALPLDVPIASLVPQLIKVVGSREIAESGTVDDSFTKEARHAIWVLSRLDPDTPLPPDITLRDAGVVDGELLRLSAQRTLSAPTLYDDVVDAAARLNKAGFAGWDATAARWMTFAGVAMVSAAWAYFLLADAFTPNRATFVAVSVVVVLTLVGAAALAQRSYGQSDIGAALGWAVLPIVAATGWVALSGLGGRGLAVGCAAMVVVATALFRAIGTGHWGYLAAGVFFGLSGIAVVLRTAGVRADMVGAGLAVMATLGCLAVPCLPVRSARPKQVDPSSSPSAANDVWAGVRRATVTRSGVYAGLTVSAGLGTALVLHSSAQVQWSELAFASVCAATLGLYTLRPATAVERAALGVPAAVVGAASCAQAYDAVQPIRLAAFGALLVITVLFAVIGSSGWADPPPARVRTGLAYLSYLSTAAVIPLALWVSGAYGRLGVQ